MRRRNGSTYNNLLGSGSGTRNRPIAVVESGPCCQDSPTSLLHAMEAGRCAAGFHTRPPTRRRGAARAIAATFCPFQPTQRRRYRREFAGCGPGRAPEVIDAAYSEILLAIRDRKLRATVTGRREAAK